MNIKIQQAENSIENVSNSVISALYNAHINGDISQEVDSNNQKVGLIGSITAPAGYGFQVSALNSAYPKFHVTVTNEYIFFKDSVLEEILFPIVSSDGVGITARDCQSITSFSALNLANNESKITSFDELEYFTNITSIPQGGLDGQTQLTSINLKNIGSIGNGVFDGRTQLSNVGNTSNLRILNKFAFLNCSSLQSIDLSSVTTLGNEVFKNTGITEVNMPSLQQTSYSVFQNCTSLQTVTSLGIITTIPNSMFSGCSALTSVTISDNVTQFGSGCFSGCSSLTSITIPSSVTSIGDFAFNNCTSLNTLIISRGYVGGQHTFENCLALNKIYISDIASWYTVSATPHNNAHPMSCNSLKKQLFDANGEHITSVVLPEGITTPTNFSETNVCRAFCNSDITFVDLPSTITVLGGFSNCISLTSVDFSKVVNFITIGNSCFSQCSNLILDITNVPQTITTIQNYAFQECSNVTGSVNFPNLTSLGTASFKYSGITSINNLGSITSISYECFRGCSNLSNVVLPSTCTSIGYYALAGAGNGTGTINTTNITKMDEGALAGSKFTGSIDLSNLTTFNKHIIMQSEFTNLILPWSTAQRINQSSVGLKNCLGSAKNIRTITTDFTQWTILPMFVGYTNLQPFVLYQPNLLTNNTTECMFGLSWIGGRTNGASIMYQIYWPNLTSVISNNYRGERNGIIGGYNGNVQTDLVYLKSISTLEAGTFLYTQLAALVINNTTPPTLPDTLNNNVQTHLYDGWSATYINYIYVPDSAVSTYKSAWTATNSSKIKSIHELNNGVVYSTETDWITAGRPIGLIAEYLGLNTADLATFMSDNNLTYWTNPNE